jgi:nucleotide-binding universal stress UspA family protein
MRAAIWAVDEAVSRDTALLLMTVVDRRSRHREREYERAQAALHRAWKAAEETGQPVKIESNIVEGDPVTELIEVSRTAEMVCVGARGTRDSAHHDPGSVAVALAQGAFAPVAIVQRRHTRKRSSAGQWVVAALETATGSHAVLDTAFVEAVLRKAPVLALTPWSAAGSPKAVLHESIREKLDHYLADADDDVEVQMSTLPMADHIANLIEQSADIDQLVIIGPDDPGFVTDVIDPKLRKKLRHTDCSILILRHRAD